MNIPCFIPSQHPVRTNDAPEHSVTVAIIDEHGLDGIGWYDYKDEQWRFHTDTLVDYNELGAPSEWMWYYIPVTWGLAKQNKGNVKLLDAQSVINQLREENERLKNNKGICNSCGGLIEAHNLEEAKNLLKEAMLHMIYRNEGKIIFDKIEQFLKHS